MAVRPQVHWHAVEDHGVVGAVIEVEASQEILVGLAATRMLHSHHAGHRFQQIGGFEHRPHQQVGAADGAFTGGGGRAHQIGIAAEYDDLLGGLLRQGARAGNQRANQGSQWQFCKFLWTMHGGFP